MASFAAVCKPLGIVPRALRAKAQRPAAKRVFAVKAADDDMDFMGELGLGVEMEVGCVWRAHGCNPNTRVVPDSTPTIARPTEPIHAARDDNGCLAEKEQSHRRVSGRRERALWNVRKNAHVRLVSGPCVPGLRLSWSPSNLESPHRK